MRFGGFCISGAGCCNVPDLKFIPVFRMTERAGSKLDVILPHLVIKYRWLIIALTIVIVVGAGSGMRFLTISTEYRDNFGPNNPQLLAFEKLEATFSRVDNIFFGIAPKKGDAFTPETLQVVADLTDEAGKRKGFHVLTH